MLLDSGIAATPEDCVRAELAEAGLRIQNISLVVNSHAHPDHMGGNAALQAICGPEFAAPAAEAAWLEDNDRVIRELWEPNPDAYRLADAERAELVALFGERVRIDRLLRDGDEIALTESRLRVITTSGHSPGHIAVHDPDRRVLFTFDDVQGFGTPVAGTGELLAPLYHDVARYKHGLSRLRDVDFETMVPSHGDPLPRDAALARIEESLRFVDAASEFVADFVDVHDRVSLRELATAMGTRWQPLGGLNLQTVSVARAHLDDLARAGRVETYWTKAELAAAGGTA